ASAWRSPADALTTYEPGSSATNAPSESIIAPSPLMAQCTSQLLITLPARSLAFVENRTTSPVRAFVDRGPTLSELTGLATTETAIVAFARSQAAVMFALPGFRPI